MTEITNYITNDFRAIDSQETIASVQDFFADLNFSHFPILENGIFIGSIASDDVETFDTDKKAIDYKYTLERFFARKSMMWLDVLEVFAKNHTNTVPVIDENNIYVGYYEMEDIMKFFQETPFLKEQGGIIIVQKGLLDYSMGQVAQIVESNNGKILGCFVSEADLENVQITVKIGVGPMNEIIQTFRRYNYEIISEHQEDAYINSLKERSDYLDKYLNI
ncbi:CBS domain-containing protein [Flavobacterium sp. MMLR14_040]|jgi:predicted transcriptional regulator|uniref:Acetoin utilization protein acuB n=1 Tax=Flavobacterium pectinovorum TaxID=29533 RepID=A0AB36P3Z0_9FLAO|nr:MULTISPECIES: CBS domain-containing protein [Flavobacterium]KIQ19153.1 acetoin utilization protein acuB [Flavobacterium sp. MEB061]MDW8852337.1 CBS domain-containing protein [Flavobacterium sp. MMLR14_040]OXB06062.1 acetoin utilization protein acuB [Flavobacterium pectinovorum]WKL47379.1 CBS domain-containing protein [Flavobacterium pectinovorum]SHM93896.1 CBS domain-containing protein [Flavobacterium pectinovorum]